MAVQEASRSVMPVRMNSRYWPELLGWLFGCPNHCRA
jgi:hypothetical protein